MPFSSTVEVSSVPPQSSDVVITDPQPVLVADRYELMREAGRGGMCVVHEARHRYTERLVAVKRLLPAFARKAEMRARLIQEAVALGLVRHPGVVDILDAGESGGGPYIVMEMLAGRTVEGLLAARGALPLADALAIGKRAASAVAAVHDAGIIHRDIKPGNLVVLQCPETHKKRLKLIDFGIARLPESAVVGERLSRASTVLGTPEYLPLELLTASGLVTPAADVYALGVTLYECLTGVVPFAGSYGEVLRQAAMTEARPVRDLRPEVPRGVEDVVMRALARDPGARFEDAGEFRDALQEASEQVTSTPPPLPSRDGSPRRHARVPYMTPVRVRFEQGLLEGRSEDLSESGLLVLMPIPLPEGTEVHVRFALPITGEIAVCRGVVRWVKPREARTSAVGLELLDIPARMKAIIADYVRAGE